MISNKKLIEIIVSSLRKAVKNGKRIDGLSRQLMSFHKEEIELSELDFLKEAIRTGPVDCRPYALKILCHFGFSISEFDSIVLSQSSSFIKTFIECAEKEENEDSLLLFIEEDNKYLQQAIAVLKRMGKEELLASLFFSDNVEFSNCIKRIIDVGGKK